MPKLPGPEQPAFVGGLRVAEPVAAVSTTTFTYRAYDAEAIGRYLEREAGNPGIDPVQTAAIIPGVFRSFAIPMKNFPVSGRWAPIYRAVSACAGNACGSKHRAFNKMVGSARQAGFLAKLERVNRGVNGMIVYRRDKAVYGNLDHWAKPVEILYRGAGDCEDFAILKMAALVDAGIPAQSMSLVVLQDSQNGVFHAVLSVTTGSGIFILDNVRNNVVKDTNLPSYVPLYSFSTDRAWIHGYKTGGSQVAEAKGGFASIAPGEGPQPATPTRPMRPGWMPAVGG
ncbi:transglutaminase-like cysteine peptidase [Mesorhizobium sp. KR9-304]|uniref:transglutaminase-like cysteine peptidase n=1 Tax=Mesorhizobium sp. KR9-304 TaxID=3156614 RepID=UPI0032B61C80